MTTEPRDVRTWLTDRVADYLRRSPDDIDPGTPLAEYGLDSLAALAISADLEDEFDVVLDSAVTWDHPTIDALSAVVSSMTEEKARP